jgi:hypothetical protein
VSTDRDIFADVDEPRPTPAMPAPGEHVDRECRAHGHGVRDFGLTRLYHADEFDPECVVCRIYAEHDHLHLGDMTGASCQTLGIGGQPGKTVRCKCGSYHH